ncbi:hypothetical protein D917_00047, partial [Trichinella nativa]
MKNSASKNELYPDIRDFLNDEIRKDDSLINIVPEIIAVEHGEKKPEAEEENVNLENYPSGNDDKPMIAAHYCLWRKAMHKRAQKKISLLKWTTNVLLLIQVKKE